MSPSRTSGLVTVEDLVTTATVMKVYLIKEDGASFNAMEENLK
jgi:hypothetical protein